MLIKNWIQEHVSFNYINFEILCRKLLVRARKTNYETSENEIRILLERLISEDKVEAYQFLAEDRRYSPTIYDKRNIYWYWFKSKSTQADKS